MVFISTTALFVCSFAVLFPYGTAIETVSVNVNSSCTVYETPCTFGCCPYEDGVCCVDGFECCQHGQTCIPYLGLCIGLQNKDGETSLVQSKSTPIRSSLFHCPYGTTTCGPDKCCRYPNAVCCSDGKHCCPHGYTCDQVRERCVKDSTSNWNFLNEEVTVPSTLRNKSPYKSCPGNEHVCPSYMSCCINNNGRWGCCPNPFLPQLKFGGGECCDTIFGHMCCPDDFPTCTVFGCTK